MRRIFPVLAEGSAWTTLAIDTKSDTPLAGKGYETPQSVRDFMGCDARQFSPAERGTDGGRRVRWKALLRPAARTIVVFTP